MRKMISAVLLLAMSGCASKAQNISATYVSPLQYQSYTCPQVGDEISRIGRKVTEVSGQQDRTAGKDAAAMTVGLILFWPALFLLPGGEHKDELARLKGEYEALEGVAISKDCKTVTAEIEKSKQQQQEAIKAKNEKSAAEKANNGTDPWNS